MTTLEQVLFDLVKPMVLDQDAIEVSELPTDGKDVTLQVTANSEDIARLIGRKGAMATAIRQVMSVASMKEDKRINIKFLER